MMTRTMRPRSKFPPQTPAQRQAKRRAIKNGTWHAVMSPAVADRLRSLVKRHESGKTLSAAERAEAQGLLDIAEYFVVQRLRNRLAA